MLIVQKISDILRTIECHTGIYVYTDIWARLFTRQYCAGIDIGGECIICRHRYGPMWAARDMYDSDDIHEVRRRLTCFYIDWLSSTGEKIRHGNRMVSIYDILDEPVINRCREARDIETVTLLNERRRKTDEKY